VHRTYRSSTPLRKANASVAGGAFGGAATGAALGFLASTVPARPRAAVATITLLSVAAGMAFLFHRPWQRNTETSQLLLEKGPLRWAFLNGALLGVGFTSRIGFWLWYVIPITVWMSGSAIAGMAVWGLYGGARLLASGVVALHISRGGVQPDVVGDRLLAIKPILMSRLGAATVALVTALFAIVGLG